MEKYSNFEKSILTILSIVGFIMVITLVSVWMNNAHIVAIQNNVADYKKDVDGLENKIKTIMKEEQERAVVMALEEKRIDSIVNTALKRHNNMIDDRTVAEIVKEVDKKVDSIDGFNRKDIIFAIIDKETTWGTVLKSWDGSSYGAMQVHFKVWKNQCNLSSVEDLYDTNTAVDCGVDVFMIYLKKYNGDVRRALQGYRGSVNPKVNATYAEDVLRRAKLYTALNA